MSLRILHTNDLHGKLTPEKVQSLPSHDLYFDTGDCIRTGNLGIPLGPDPAWGLLAQAGCDASVIGNRETHVLEAVFQSKLAGARHPVLCGNLRKKDGSRPLPGTLLLERQGLRIGVLGVSVPMVTERSRARAASAYLWDQPVGYAVERAAELRRESDLVVALTHIGLARDVQLAQATEDIDIILGGHSHSLLFAQEKVNRTFVCQGGSHARYYGLYEWSGDELQGGLVGWT